MEHKYDTPDVVSRVATRFRGVTHQYIRSKVSEYLSVKSYAIRLRGVKDTSLLSRLRPPQTGERGNMLRVSIKGTFDDPSKALGRRRRDIGFTYDVPIKGTMGELRQFVRDEAIVWANKHYGINLSEAGRRIRGIDISGLELI